MKHKKLFEKAYARLREHYGGDFFTPDVKILSRFYQEKTILGESELYMRYLDLFGKIREAANQKGEHILVRGTTGSSFIAYLLGATETNPLPMHEYCPHCHAVQFTEKGIPPDHDPSKCSCGGEFVCDGYDIPFESNLKSILMERIQLCVSHAFYDEAKAMISDEMWDKALVILKNEDRTPTWLCFLDKETNEGGEYMLSGNSELFDRFPRITLVPHKMLDQRRELEKVTGFKMKDIGAREAKQMLPHFLEGNIENIPHFDNRFMRGIRNTVNPKSYDDLLKLIGFAYSTNIWKNNAEHLFMKNKMELSQIPAYRDELYQMISSRLYQKGICDTGLAYEITGKAMRGYYAKTGGLDEDVLLALFQLDFDYDFIAFLEKINYMFPKAHGAAYLREAVAMMFYKTKFNKEYNEIVLKI